MNNKIIRYNPSINEGLSTKQVNERITNNLINYNDQPPTKTIKQIIMSNFFTYFNFINVVLGVAIIGAGIYGGEIFESLKNCLFMGVIVCNSIISIIQEITSKKVIDKLSVISSSKATVLRNNNKTASDQNVFIFDIILKILF